MPGSALPARQALPAMFHGFDQQLAQINSWIQTSGAMSGKTIAMGWREKALSLAAGVWTQVPIDAVTADYTTATAGFSERNSKGELVKIFTGYVAPVAGFYQVSAMVAATFPASSTAIAAIYVGGVAALRGARQVTASSGATLVDNTVSGVVFANTGEHIDLYGFNSGASGAALEVANGATENYLHVYRVA
jgi:hypothetical protein